ncbi:hypothetical protein ACFC1B_31065, partial [Streptomyces xiamenensis]
MRASPRLRLASLASAVTGFVAVQLAFATRAFADEDDPPETENDEECDLIRGAARDYCEGDAGTGGGGGGGTSRLDSTLDPLSSLAQGCADAAAWIVDQLSAAVSGTTNVD